MKHRIYEVRWDKKEKAWMHGFRLAKYGPQYGIAGWTKRKTETWARESCRKIHDHTGHPIQLLIYTKFGRIGKGGRNEASYGCDSKRRKG